MTLLKVQIKAKSRLHLSLLSMHDSGTRINGGLGFSIADPFVVVTAVASEHLSAHDSRSHPMSNGAIERLISTLRQAINAHNLKLNVSFIIEGGAVANSGFGSGTAIRLACLEAMYLINGIEMSDDELVALSNRGGTSGIGINTYFHGGFCVDLGRKNRVKHEPSFQAESTVISKPMLLKSIKIPSWDIGILLPSDLAPITEKQEKLFFKNTCPIEPEESYKAFYFAIADGLASIQDEDKISFEQSIRDLQNCEWKKSEKLLYGNSLLHKEQELYELGASAVGMSSLGPCLFFLAKDIDDVVQKFKERYPADNIYKTKPDNTGREILCLS